MWKQHLGAPPVRRFTKGHFYQLFERGDEVPTLAEFSHKRKITVARSTNFYYVFHNIARNFGNSIPNRPSKKYLLSEPTLVQIPVKEVHVKDFPLYISWYTWPAFSEILKTGHRKTRKKSKLRGLRQSPLKPIGNKEDPSLG